jgi:hypothetical protein
MQNNDPAKIMMIAGIILFMTPFLMIPILMISPSTGFFCFLGSFGLAAVGMILMVVSQFVSKGSSLFGSFSNTQNIPPVQYPRHAKTYHHAPPVKEFDCPNCGAPPKYIDPHGLCMCEFCNTKYKVR